MESYEKQNSVRSSANSSELGEESGIKLAEESELGKVVRLDDRDID